MVDEITIRVSGRIVERIIWIVIVVLLIIALIWSNVADLQESSDKYRDQVGDDAKDSDSKTESKDDEDKEADSKETPKDTSSDSRFDDPSASELGIVDGKATIKLSKRPITEIRGTPQNRYLRATVFSFEILNGLKDFKPKVHFYIYDDNDDKEEYKEVIIYDDKISEKNKEFKENERISISFNEITIDKTLELELYDEEGELLDTYIEIINFND